MPSSCPEELDATRQLGELVMGAGSVPCRVLARRTFRGKLDLSLSVRDIANATKWAHDGKVLGQAAMRVLD
jgi:hypothetical protein